MYTCGEQTALRCGSRLSLSIRCLCSYCLFFSLVVERYGAEAFRREFLGGRRGNGFKVGRWFDVAVRCMIPAHFAVLVGWWFYQTVDTHPRTWWNPLVGASLGTCVVQLGLLLGVVVFLAKRLHGGVRGKHF